MSGTDSSVSEYRIAAAWSQPFSVANALVSLLFSLLALLLWVAAAATYVVDGDAVAAIGFSCVGILVSILVVTALRSTGFRNFSPGRAVRNVRSDDHGAGLAVARGYNVANLIGAAICLGSGYWAMLYVASRGGDATTLVSPGRATQQSESSYILLGAITLLIGLALIAIRIRASVTIYESGIQRMESFRFTFHHRRTTTFLGWDEMAGVVRDVKIVPTGWGAQNIPVLRLVRSETAPGQSNLDTAQSVGLAVNRLPVDAQTLYSLAKSMFDSEDRRRLLATPEARLLLTPPPLRERWAAAKRLKREAEDAERSST